MLNNVMARNKFKNGYVMLKEGVFIVNTFLSWKIVFVEGVPKWMYNF